MIEDRNRKVIPVHSADIYPERPSEPDADYHGGRGHDKVD